MCVTRATFQGATKGVLGPDRALRTFKKQKTFSDQFITAMRRMAFIASGVESRAYHFTVFQSRAEQKASGPIAIAGSWVRANILREEKNPQNNANTSNKIWRVSFVKPHLCASHKPSMTVLGVKL